ncbi:MAG: hypothetical protein GX558_10955 [Clostridiales bacterium]|nr:hypothetical protein [Clostridiales bacterium]
MLYRLLGELPTALAQFFQFALICAVMGAIMFVVGELMPRRNLDPDSFPFRSFGWERSGEAYHALGIQRWKDRVPDMSKHVKWVFAKKITSYRDPEYLLHLIRETCVAEVVHEALVLLSPVYLVLLDGIYGVVFALLYALGNVPFILIQRYNRPRLVQLRERQLALARRRANAAM